MERKCRICGAPATVLDVCEPCDFDLAEEAMLEHYYEDREWD